ncbi:MAG TPA: hypothetical protein VGL72_01000 [Bryobacteraceae bacterium]
MGRLRSYAPTGDVGLRRRAGVIQLERCGPFMPPITLPGVGDIVVPNSTRRQIELAGLTGITWQSVDKVRIVKSDWETWTTDEKLPPALPSGGEPENYILGQPHDPATAASMGELWEIVLDKWGTGIAEIISRRPRETRVKLSDGDKPMPDLFNADGIRYTFVSVRAREWLQQHCPEWVSFQTVEWQH